jgi:hypothetical protein
VSVCRSPNLSTAGDAGTSNYIPMARRNNLWLVTGLKALLLCLTLGLCADSAKLLTFFKKIFSHHVKFLKKSGDCGFCSCLTPQAVMKFLSCQPQVTRRCFFAVNFQRSLIYTTGAQGFVLPFLCGKGHVTGVPENKNVEYSSQTLLEIFV